ncbi:alpha-tocopherol transfer protein-like [Argiope bruennichi]|uniref:alpha-tocopherol transfer protein-like n=1 Tax=Argiope bruennichi TaxID=94029 RepID=UPI0024946751|nr:alpha-tocopherol transfer protein-like [Argiope bruennichi]XP_055945159.1 alpha-tocopherol transfer protein-like [Argiope bruennichi]
MEGKNSFSKHLQDADVLPLEITYIPECVLVKSDQELNLPQEERNSRLLELIKLLEGNKVSKGIVFQQDFLHRYLIHSRYDVNRAFSRVRNYLSLNKHHNYFFQSIKYDFTAHHSCKFITMLPHRCSDGTITLLYEMGNWNPTETPFEVVKQLTFMTYMQELRNPVTQLAGVNAIFDFTHTGFQHLKCCTPYNIYLLNHVSFEVVPVIYRKYHLINGNAAMNTLLALIKPFMPSFMKKILTIHSSSEELLKYYPRSMLPTKYGGSLSEYYMADRLKKINEEHDNYIVEGQRNTF